MIENLKTLWELQKVDSELSGLKAKTENIPQQIAQITEELKTKEQEIEAKKAKEKDLSSKRKRLDQDIDASKDKVGKYKSQLLSVKTNKEYQALLHEINTEEVKISSYEEQQIESFSESDDLKKEIGKLNKELEQDKKKFTSKQKDLETELTQVKQACSVTEGKHKSLATQLPTALLSRYEQIKKGRGGIGIVGIQGEICDGCKTLFPPQFVVELRKGDKVLTCEQCGRILVWVGID